VRDERRQVLNRLKRIEGQIKGIVKMIEEENSCADVLMQVAAVRAAVNSVGTVIFETHFRQCLEKAIREEKNPDFINEVMSMLGKYIK
jgi:DNA-binding FrmR family transcriptional regulator